MRMAMGLAVLMAAGALAGTAAAKSKKNKEVPQLFCQAQFVYVQTYEGDPLNVNVVPEDRAAAQRVIEQLESWKRYKLVNEKSQADLVFVVRTGRAVMAQAGSPGMGGPAGPNNAGENPSGMGSAPGGMNPGMGPGAGGPGMGTPNSMGGEENGGRGPMGAAAGPADDLLAIYQRPGDVQTQEPLWRKSKHDGLDAPKMQLFEEMKDAVDAACKEPAAGAH